ncbi:hypothetical protein F5Y03DRAFT_45069 [Xylaria venustula]|nr:hypothetical protein F5Y03DRAFT_45069 [Xylaria venustula]
MLSVVACIVFFVLSQCAYGHIIQLDGHQPIREARDGLMTQFVTTVSTCSWSPFVTIIPPMTTVYAVIAESLDPAAAVGQTVSLGNDLVVIIATGVQNIGTCTITAPEIITTTRVETGMAPVDCSYVTYTVTEAIMPSSTVLFTDTVIPTTIITTEVVTSQQTITLDEGITQTTTVLPRGWCNDDSDCDWLNCSINFKEGASDASVCCKNECSCPWACR